MAQIIDFAHRKETFLRGAILSAPGAGGQRDPVSVLNVPEMNLKTL
jgi:hypothetical protein